MKRPEDFTVEEIEAALDGCYAQMPVTDLEGLACVLNKALEQRYGAADD